MRLHPLATPTYLFGHHCTLNSVGHSIYSCCHPQVVQTFILLAYRILSIDAGSLHVSLAQSFPHFCLLGLLLLLTPLGRSLHLLGGELEGGREGGKEGGREGGREEWLPYSLDDCALTLSVKRVSGDQDVIMNTAYSTSLPLTFQLGLLREHPSSDTHSQIHSKPLQSL